MIGQSRGGGTHGSAFRPRTRDAERPRSTSRNTGRPPPASAPPPCRRGHGVGRAERSGLAPDARTHCHHHGPRTASVALETHVGEFAVDVIRGHGSERVAVHGELNSATAPLLLGSSTACTYDVRDGWSSTCPASAAWSHIRSSRWSPPTRRRRSPPRRPPPPRGPADRPRPAGTTTPAAVPRRPPARIGTVHIRGDVAGRPSRRVCEAAVAGGGRPVRDHLPGGVLRRPWTEPAARYRWSAVWSQGRPSSSR